MEIQTNVALPQSNGFHARPVPQARGRVLVADPDPSLLHAYERFLRKAGFEVEATDDGIAAATVLAASRFDAVVIDTGVSGMDGIQLLRAIRGRDADLPVILTSGAPDVRTAMKAVEYGALRYLGKPVELPELEQVVRQAVQLRTMADLKRQALEQVGKQTNQVSDRAGLEANYARAFEGIWMAFQPIVRWSTREAFAYEALLRSSDGVLSNPAAMLDAATRLGKLVDLGQKVRRLVAQTAMTAPPEPLLFVNLHPLDLEDDALHSFAAPLSAHAHRCVLEITERMSLDAIKDARSRIMSLRMLGYRIAIDDVGAGYAGLACVAQLEPEIVKIDMSLVRNMDREPLKRGLVSSMIEACTKMGMEVIAEGVETVGERDALVEAGCDLMQGFLFARPAAPFVQPVF